jgi:RNA polymerase sigma factor (TIGR02999 family)
MEMSNEPLADLAKRAEAGDIAARDALFTALYTELHRLAETHVRRSPGNVTLSATTLLHEAYVDISRRSSLAFPDRNRFLQYASRAMRGLVIEYMRRRGARKRGGELTFTTLEEDRAQSFHAPPDLEELGAALDSLAELDPMLAELVDLKFFCGFSMAEIAAMRAMSERSVQRDWAKARLLLRRFLQDEQPGGSDT